MLIGSRTNDPARPVLLSGEGLLHHTLVVGQSGSGKSFFVARLLEEIVLATRARAVIVDPNGDFRSVSQVAASVWADHSGRLAELTSIAARTPNFDKEETFREAWGNRRFLSLHPAVARLPADTPMALHRKLLIHWDSLDDDDRDFLLRGTASTPPRTLLGLEACVDFARYFADRPHSPYGNDLRGLINAAEQFAARNISLRQYPYAKDLAPDDWYAVRAALSELVRRHAIWWSRTTDSATRPPGLSDFIDGPFEGAAPRSESSWDVLILSLDAAREADSLLVVNASLSRLWRDAKSAWRTVNRDSNTADGRVPTFVVIDEAQNYAPARTGNPLRARVTDQLLQIAAEGRKYGVYLILATQRPTKLHPELVPECENSCLLRVQSRLDTEFAASALGIASNLAVNAPSFRKGQGLISGRWIDSEVAVDARFAPARSVVGGAGLPTQWAVRSEASQPYASSDVRLRDAIRAELHASPAPIPLVNLAEVVRTQFPDVDDGSWQGALSFKTLITNVGIDDLAVSSAGPGYAYLKGVHENPDTGPLESSWQYSDASSETVRDVLIALHRNISLPVLDCQEFRAIYEALSDVVQEQPFNLTDTSKAVRDLLTSRGTPVRRIYIGYVIKGISWSGHRFDVDLPQDPKSLAAAFCRQLSQSTPAGSPTHEDGAIGALVYCSGGLLTLPEAQALRRGIPFVEPSGSVIEVPGPPSDSQEASGPNEAEPAPSE